MTRTIVENQRGSSMLAVIAIIGAMATGGIYLMSRRGQVSTELSTDIKAEAAFRKVLDRALLDSRAIQNPAGPPVSMRCSDRNGTYKYGVPEVIETTPGGKYQSLCYHLVGRKYLYKVALIDSSVDRVLSSVALQVDGDAPPSCGALPPILGGYPITYDPISKTYKAPAGCSLKVTKLLGAGKYTFPAGATQVVIQAIGAGGGGAKEWSTASGAGGGFVSGILDVGLTAPGGVSMDYSAGGGGWAHTKADYYIGCIKWKKGKCTQMGQIWIPGGSGTDNGGPGGDTTVTWAKGSLKAGGGGGGIKGGTRNACVGGCYYGPPSAGGPAAIAGNTLNTPKVQNGAPSQNAQLGGHGASSGGGAGGGGGGVGCNSPQFGSYGYGGKGMVNEGATPGQPGAVFVTFVSCP